jgi:hypothetical protein
VSGSQEVHHKREWQKGCCGEEEEEKQPDRDRASVYKGGAAKQERERERERTGLNQIKSNKTSPKSVCAILQLKKKKITKATTFHSQTSQQQ